MKTIILNPRNWGVGTKITVFTFGLISVILALLLTLINMSTSAMLKERAKANVANTWAASAIPLRCSTPP
jgi:methyl-accepting chemotaxis protein-2 (aspartate sensor receptor)